MQDLVARLQELLSNYLPNILIAVAILIVGWLAAILIASVVRGATNRVAARGRFEETIDQVRPATIGAWAGRIVFYSLMLFVLAGAFQALRLQSVAGPLDTMLQRVTAYLPQLAGAAILLGVAWLIGTVLRFAVRRGLGKTRIEERLAEGTGLETSRPLSEVLGEVVFWGILLLFMPAVLGVLELQGLIAPLERMADDVLRVLPDLLGATLILLLGWLVAKTLSRIVTGLLTAGGLDALGERIGMGADAGPRRLSRVVGLVVYVLVLIPAAIAAFDALQIESISGPATEMLGQLLAAIPLLFAASVLLVVAYLLARVLSGLTLSLLEGIGFDRLFSRLGLKVEAGDAGQTPSQIASYLVLVAVMVIGAIEASELLGFGALAELATDFFVFSARLVLGLVIFGLGLYLGHLAFESIPRRDSRWPNLYASAARLAIIVLATTMALQQTGVAADIVTLTFALLLGSIAVAAAIAFGLGARDAARRVVEDWSEGAEPR